ncbi:MAG: DUF898 domain-containing protein [Marinovum sp.]|nr:DUF898 domain-containing protein [Marinovum sp.]
MENVSTQPSAAGGRYLGQGADIFKLALKTGFLTFITLGIYRFWAKTRVRKFIWSSTELEGTRFEYTGTGLEKFLGFLVAVVILAIYLGIIQMLLFFFGISLFREAQSDAEAIAQSFAGFITVLAVLPVIYFAVYRARRYKLARTRWRSIRFGMENAAWGYAMRALGYGFMSIISLGILMPLATFKLEKYMTDRSWFGDAKFEQHGRWTRLYGAMKHIFIGLGWLLGAAVFAAISATPLAAILGFIGCFWIIIGSVYYNVHSFRYLTANKTLGGEITFKAEPFTSTVVLTYIGGSIAIALLLGTLGAIIAASLAGPAMLAPEAMLDVGLIQFIPLLIYIIVLVVAGAMSLAMIVQPIIRHYVETLAVINTDAFGQIAQRASDEGADAEGFADALDIGGAI